VAVGEDATGMLLGRQNESKRTRNWIKPSKLRYIKGLIHTEFVRQTFGFYTSIRGRKYGIMSTTLRPINGKQCFIESHVVQTPSVLIR
jgi:hypothetical protein